ncbi:hypothetical protein [Deinococcus budaensis]|uniref:Uncharacterized protein n=1 Tax=Deinococcus budaensis TaxID=1665626 RepID=A0A7W8GCX2_9DEIO|nr:hypothetical protein [Deinococcus budaensis]
MNKVLTLLGLLTLTSAGAVSGPSESRVPRAAEVDAVIRAVCHTKTDLGRLKGCEQQVYEGRPSEAILSPKWGGVLSVVHPGSFSAPNQKELLATFCTESFSCSGETVLLRQLRGQWQAVSLVPGLLPFQCLSYPRPGGTQAAVCLSANARGEPFGSAIKIASWTGGKVKVETVALFPYLSYVDPNSEQCAGRWDYQPFSWKDRDRNADRVPDLTVLATLDIYQGGPELCRPDSPERQSVGGGRRDLTFVWTGETLKPTGNTAALIEKYARGR